MNRIYRTRKNRRTGALTAVSELKHADGKKTVSLCAAAVTSALVALGLAVSPAVLATPWSTGEDINLSKEIDDGMTHIPGPDFTEGDVAFAFGDSKTPAKTYVTDIYLADSDPSALKTYFHFQGKDSGEVTLDLTSGTVLDLFAQTKGFEQTLVSTTGHIDTTGGVPWGDLRDRFYLSTGNGEENTPETSIFYQYLAYGPDTSDRIGRASYVIGEEALNLLGVSVDKSDYINGLKWTDQTVGTYVVLSGIDLNEGKTLSLSVPAGSQTFGAKLTGAGGIALTGAGRDTSTVRFEPLYRSNDPTIDALFAGANTFTGGVRLSGLKVELARPTALGTGNTIHASNAYVWETTDGSLADNHAINFSDSEFSVINGLTAANTTFLGTNSVNSSGQTSDGNAFRAANVDIYASSSLTVSGGNATTGTLAMRGGATLTLTNDGAMVSGTDVTVFSWGNRIDASELYASTLTLKKNTSSSAYLTVTGGAKVEGALTLESGGLLSAADALVAGSLAMTGGEIIASTLRVDSSVTDLHGANTLSVNAAGEALFTEGFALAGEDTELTVNGNFTAWGDSTLEDAQLTTTGTFEFGDLSASGTSGLTADGNASGNALGLTESARVDFTSGAKIAETVSLADSATLAAEGRISANSLVLADNATLDVPEARLTESLVFENTTRTYETTTTGYGNSAYRVELNGSDVAYGDAAGQMTHVASTLLQDGSYLTVDYANKDFLGKSVAMETSKGLFNRLTLKSENGIQNLDLKLSGATEDVVELKGSGAVTLSDTFAENSADYAGWIRMTGTSLDLTTESGKLNSTLTSGQGVSVGAGGTLLYAGNTTLELNRIGWAGPGDNTPSGTLDLSGFDFSALDDDTPALRVDSVTVNGAGTIRLDQSVVTGLDDGTSSVSGDHIFQTLSSTNRRLVVETTANPNANQIHGTVDVNVVGSEEDSSTLTGYFNANGTFAGTDASDDTGVATGTWGFTTLFEDGNLYVTHGLAQVELRGEKADQKALELAVDGTTEQRFDVRLTGSGDLRKTGTGTLLLNNTLSDMSGTTYVEAGTLAADAGALGTAALDVAGSAVFELHGGQDTKNTQSVRTLNVAEGGTVEIDSDPASPDLLTLSLTEGGTFAAGSTLTGTSTSQLALAGGTLEITDLEQTAENFKGSIDLAAGTTLKLSGDDTEKQADLSLLSGTGKVILADKALYGSKAGFTGTIVVDDGWLTINKDANTGTPGNRASLAMSKGIVDSTDKTHVFKTITLTGGQLGVGSAVPGSDATGALIATDGLTLKNMVIDVDNTENQADVPAESLLAVDNETGATSWLVRLAKNSTAEAVIDADSITVNAKAHEQTSDLVQDGADVGDVTYETGVVVDATGIGINYRATALTLTGELELAGSDTVTADSTLDLKINGEDSGGIRVTDKTVTLAKTGTYGTLSVDEGAKVAVNGTQTLARGGEILGAVETAEGTELLVTGGTLTIGAAASTKFAAALDAKDAARGAALRFEGRQGTAKGKLFEGNLAARKDARVEFSGTSGNFALSSGTAAYVLEDASHITFGPAAGKDFVADKVAVDATSTAYYDLTGPAAGSVDLSGVTGEGRVSLGYREAGGTLAASSVNEAFTGTLAYSNAELVIGTDTSVANSALTHFASQQGKLEVGAGSVLGINNLKTIGSDGTVAPVPIALAGDLTVAEGATLDFTPGIRIGNGEGYLGNASGVSVNAIDMRGHVLRASGGVTVKADIKDLDFASGLPGNGSFDGSILDLIGEEPDYPVLALITNVGADADTLARLAAAMTLDAGEAASEFTVDYWQPDWTGGTGEALHVANVRTGAKIVADAANSGLAVGAGITGIDIRPNATLRIDPSASTDTGAETHTMDAVITGDDSVTLVVTGNYGDANSSVVFAADNTYTGETRIERGAEVRATAARAFASSKRVSVGTVDPARLDERTTLAFAHDAARSDTTTEHAVRALEAGDAGTVVLEDRTALTLTDGHSSFAAGSILTGTENTALRLSASGAQGVEVDFANPAETLKDFAGTFALGAGTVVNLAVEGDTPFTWHNNVGYLLDARSRALSSGEFVKTGSGTLVIDGTVTDRLPGMYLTSREGTTHLRGGAMLPGLTAASRVTVDGVASFGNLTARTGNLFELDVATGVATDSTDTLASETAGEPVRIDEIGANGSDGIRVLGTASGIFNVAVTSSTNRGAEERIRVMDIARRDDANFGVRLVDATTGAALPGLEIGGYDYVLVADDRIEDPGTDLWLSSIAGDEGSRNTAVSAGSYLGVAAAAQLFDLSLHDRMSNRSWLKANADGSIANAFWVVENVSHERYGDSTGQISVHDTASTTTLGSDVLSGLAAGGTWYAGAMFSYATEDTKSRSTRTGLESRADTDAWGAGIYAGWQLEGADRTGPYVDGWLMWTDAESDVKGLNVSETAEGNGLSASLEAGWGFKAFSYDAHGQAGDIYVEPHVSVTWFGYEADDISNDVHDVTFEGKDNIRTKLGVKTYAFGKTTGGFSPYVELNWIHNTETYGVTMSNVTVEQMGAEDQAEVRAGADWRVTDSLSVWGHFGYASGSNGYSASEGTLGLRYAF
ncbi:autotransporter outer membrane beta-barrel domain-containing protein [Sutterella megalosphaeroides]|uniref:Autotransporter domain-containing protein n=1 Tax=Sutterella megalosphaeroides TaxID=2494234 RepID=A0A2Z6ICF4_9BURK|nr:autotransporter outer membrane beta-barrel domain-containing protein [Sutterella megalosphaeroides]BBF23590.1 hypothetical protein SUTMEG_14810 [Sutterella megalosphaeroides]